MNVPIHVFQHGPFEGIGSMASDFKRLGRDIREVHWYRGDEPPADEDIRALIVLGGTMSADGDTQYPWLTREKDLIAGVVKRGRPVLGIGLGAQLIARSLGACRTYEQN